MLIVHIGSAVVERYGRFRLDLFNHHIGVSLRHQRNNRQFFAQKALVKTHILAANFKQVVKPTRYHMAGLDLGELAHLSMEAAQVVAAGMG